MDRPSGDIVVCPTTYHGSDKIARPQAVHKTINAYLVRLGKTAIAAGEWWPPTGDAGMP